MKHRKKSKVKFSGKALSVSVVALILVLLTAVSVTYSWIEEVSNVEINVNDGEKSPLHTSDKQLSEGVVVDYNVDNNLNGNGGGTNNRSGIKYDKTIDLSDCFYESGDMHLSGCYSDGVEFYYPVNKKVGNTSDGTKFRVGTKDDANVNYFSATFKVSSPSAKTHFWFNTDSIFKGLNASASEINNVNKYLKCAISVDGTTDVYSSDGSYKTITSITSTTLSSKSDGRTFSAYKWCDSGASAQSATNVDSNGDVNGNTIFAVEKGETKIVNVKIWLEYNSAVNSVAFSEINLRLDSAWNHTRKITLRNACIYNTKNSTSVNWLTKDSASVYMARQSGSGDDTSNSTKWITNSYSYVNSKYRSSSYWKYGSFTRTADIENRAAYSATITIPAVYNNEPIYFFRGQNSPTAGDANAPDFESSGLHAYNYWTTNTPDSFHDETYTIYTPEFGTWGDTVKHVGFVDRRGWGKNNVYAYFWDNSTVLGTTKVVENAGWHGEKMYELDGVTYDNKKVYVVYWDASNTNYSHVIFNDNSSAQQTSDLILFGNSQNKGKDITFDNRSKYYDIVSCKWYTEYTDMPITKSNLYVRYKNDNANSYDEGQMYVDKDNDHVFYYTFFSQNDGQNYNFYFEDRFNGTKYYKFYENQREYGKDQTSYFDLDYYWERDMNENSSTDSKYLGRLLAPKQGFYTFRWSKEYGDKVTIQFNYRVKPNSKTDERSPDYNFSS